MKKVLLLTLAALLLMSGSAFATQSRVMALGNYTAPYICDDYNLFKWPATLPSYSNLVIMTMWNADDMFEYDDYYYEAPEDGGFEDYAAYYAMTYALGDEGSWGTLGMVFTHNYMAPNPNQWMAYEIYGSWTDYNYVEHDDTEEAKWLVMYGYQMEKMSFGLYFARASEKYLYTWDDPGAPNQYEEEDTDAYTTLGVGFKMEVTEDMTAEVAFDWTKVTYNYTYTDIDDDTNSYDREMDPGKAMALRARTGYEWSEDIMLIGYINWETKDFARAPVEDVYSNTAYGYKEMDFTFGIGANLTVNEDNMILFAVEPYSMVKIEPSGYTEGYDQTFDMKYRAMPRFILALESDITDWLTFRTGCSKDLGKASYNWDDNDATDPESETYEWTDVDWETFRWNIGLGFHFGDFDIDCVLNKNIPFSMGYWLTGYQPQPSDEMTPIGMISAVYHF